LIKVLPRVEAPGGGPVHPTSTGGQPGRRRAGARGELRWYRPPDQPAGH